MNDEGSQYPYNDVMESIEAFNCLGAAEKKKFAERFDLKPYNASNVYIIGRSPGAVHVEEDLPDDYAGYYWGDCGAIPVAAFMDYMRQLEEDR